MPASRSARAAAARVPESGIRGRDPAAEFARLNGSELSQRAWRAAIRVSRTPKCTTGSARRRSRAGTARRSPENPNSMARSRLSKSSPGSPVEQIVHRAGAVRMMTHQDFVPGVLIRVEFVVLVGRRDAAFTSLRDRAEKIGQRGRRDLVLTVRPTIGGRQLVRGGCAPDGTSSDCPFLQE
jgi:hypothetical protein